MSFIAKNPLSAPTIAETPPSPPVGARGLFATNDGWHDIDDEGNVNKLATKNDVSSEVANLVNSAPETLNTLNELAQALGDDPNFATTVATQLGNKVDKEEGKSLSSNDFTDAFMNQLKNLPLINLGVFDLNLDDGNGVFNEAVYQSYIDTIDNLDSGIYTLKYIEAGCDSTEFYFVTKGKSIHGDYSSQIRFSDKSVFYDDAEFMSIEQRIYSNGEWFEWRDLTIYIDQLNSSIGMLEYLKTYNSECLVEAINEIYDDIHQTPITVIPTTLKSNQQYNFGEVENLSLTFPTVATDGNVIYLTFYSGAAPTTLTIDTTNTSDIEVIPESNTGYEIFGKFNGSIWIVNYSEYTVSEV